MVRRKKQRSGTEESSKRGIEGISALMIARLHLHAWCFCSLINQRELYSWMNNDTQSAFEGDSG